MKKHPEPVQPRRAHLRDGPGANYGSRPRLVPARQQGVNVELKVLTGDTSSLLIGEYACGCVHRWCETCGCARSGSNSALRTRPERDPPPMCAGGDHAGYKESTRVSYGCADYNASGSSSRNVRLLMDERRSRYSADPPSSQTRAQDTADRGQSSRTREVIQRVRRCVLRPARGSAWNAPGPERLSKQRPKAPAGWAADGAPAKHTSESRRDLGV